MALSLARAKNKGHVLMVGAHIKIATSALSVGLLKTLHALKKVSLTGIVESFKLSVQSHVKVITSEGQFHWSGTSSSSSSSAWCGPAPVPALGHQSVPDRSAVDECSDAVILADVFLVADILIAVVDREIEVLSAAPKVVEVTDGCPSIVGEFRRIGVVKPFHQLVDQVDELRVLVSLKKLIANSNRSSRSSMVRSP